MRIQSGPSGYMVDPDKTKDEIANAPKVENLLGRIAELFENHKLAMLGTIVLVLIGAALSVIPPLLIEQTFNQGLFPETGFPNMEVLIQLVSLMIIIFFVAAAIDGVDNVKVSNPQESPVFTWTGEAVAEHRW